jgi:flagellar hook-associated protein 2
MIGSIASSLGAGSGIDTVRLVADLAAASRDPKVAALDIRDNANKARISAVAQARSDLETFSSTFAELVAGGTLQSQPNVADAIALSAIAAPGVRLGNLSAEIVVQQLAKSQSVYSGYLAAPTATVGQGSMTLSVGGVDYAITIDATNDSLTGLAAAINASASGVAANVISDGSGARIVLKGQSGAAGGFTLTPGVGADPALDRFAYPSGGAGLTLAQAAQDASFTVDGIAYTRTTNSFTDVLPGVTLTLKKAAPGVPIAITSARPTATIRQTLNDFISVYNTLRRDVASARASTGGDQSLRSLEQQLASLISQTVTSDPNINSLTDIGVGTNRDGSISLDSVKLEAALTANPDAVEALFSPTRDATHDAVTDPGLSGSLQSLKNSATASGGMLASLKLRLEKEGASIADARERMEARETAYRNRLTRQFGSMDARVNALKATQSYLAQQIKLWSNGSN